MHSPLRIQDVLMRPVFKGAQLLAGASGIDRPLRWIHILEVLEVRNMLRGGELVLTTGMGFSRSTEDFRSYMEQLIEGKAVGLCMELGTAVKEVPPEILQIADAHGFPLIVFNFQVRFVDITQDVHSLILNRHHKLLDDMEHIARRLQQYTVGALGMQHILSFIREVTGHTVLYFRNGQKPVVLPHARTGPAAIVKDFVEELHIDMDGMIEPTAFPIPAACAWTDRCETAVAQTVFVVGIPRATLVLLCNASQVNEYLMMVVDRAASALAQDEFHRLAAQEQQLFHEQDWVEQLIRGERLQQSIVDPAAQNGREKRYCSVIIHISGLVMSVPGQFGEDWRSHQLPLSMLIRLPFVAAQFRPYLSLRRDAIIAVLEYDGSHANVKPGIAAAIEQLRAILRKNGVQNQGILVGVGREAGALSAVKHSYQEAATALAIRNGTSDASIFFYDEAGIYRWVALLGQDEQARQLANDDLQAVIEYDQKHHTNLFETLRAYLDCDRSKQQTADRLFIHRQTLYHRLEQIDQLLAVDLADPVRRLALHVSVYYHLLHP
ncbi:MAG: PucR family transcriptional regulator [Bacilli bacterium]